MSSTQSSQESQSLDKIFKKNLKILQGFPWFTKTFDSSDLDILGSGAFGVVISVYHKKFKRKVALKVVEAETQDLNEVIEELVKMKTLKHPNILEILEHRLILHKDQLFLLLVMEQGLISLNSYLVEKQMGLNEVELSETMKALCSAITYAHQNNIVHCDIKPGNIILFKKDSKKDSKYEKSDYIPKIADWGSAYEFKDFNNHSATEKKTGMNFTPLFLAPELRYFLEGNDNAKKGDFFSGDVYALGITLLRCAGLKFQDIQGLSGEQDQQFYEPKMRKLLRQLKDDKGMSKEIIDIIKKMIVFEPNERSLPVMENKMEVKLNNF